MVVGVLYIVRCQQPLSVTAVSSRRPAHPSLVERHYGVPPNVPSQEGIEGSSLVSVLAAGFDYRSGLDTSDRM